MAHSHRTPDSKGPDRLGEFRSYAKEELIAHLPYTLIGVLAAVLIVLGTLASGRPFFGEEQFHMAHFVHIFFSAAAGSAIFRTYHESLRKAVPVVLISSVSLCTLSDSFIPYAAFAAFGKHAHIHVCALEHPLIVLFCGFSGFLLGIVGIRFFDHCNRTFHLLHILISTAASVLYIISFVDGIFTGDIGAVALTIFFALVVPCLLGDVMVPLCFVKLRSEFLHEKVHHSHKPQA